MNKWNTYRIKDVAKFISEKANDCSLPYIALDNIVSWDGYYVPSDSTSDGNSNVCKKGDVLFGKLRPYLAKGYIPTQDSICSPEFIVLRPTDLINNSFLLYYLLSYSFVSYIKNQVAGVKMPRTNALQIGQVSFAVPSIEEQELIVSYLDKECDKITKEIDLLERKVDCYSRLRRSLINRAVTRGLNPNVLFKSSTIEWVGYIPVHWTTSRFAFFFKEHKKSNKGINNQNLLSLSFGRIIRKNIDSCEGLLPESFDTYQIIEPGNIIFRFTDLQNDHKSLRVGLVNEEGIITSAYTCVQGSEETLPKFAFYMLYSYDIKKVFYKLGGGMRQSLNYKMIKDMKVVFPPLDEQREIVDYLDQRCNKIDSIIEKIKLKIERLKELKRSLINEVVTGQRTVKTSDL